MRSLGLMTENGVGPDLWDLCNEHSGRTRQHNIRSSGFSDASLLPIPLILCRRTRRALPPLPAPRRRHGARGLVDAARITSPAVLTPTASGAHSVPGAPPLFGGSERDWLSVVRQVCAGGPHCRAVRKRVDRGLARRTSSPLVRLSARQGCMNSERVRTKIYAARSTNRVRFLVFVPVPMSMRLPHPSFPNKHKRMCRSDRNWR